MTEFVFKNAKFIKTAIKSKDYPLLKDDTGKVLPEIAVVGRSNVGKSTLLNHLFQKKDMVKTSATPGKTQALNFFTLNNQIVFVDLPGYGYAKVPLSVRKNWGPMIQAYFEVRHSLKLVLFLFDIRRLPNEEDRELVRWLTERGSNLLLVLTKTDKVKRNEKNANITKILEGFRINLPCVSYSSVKNEGRNLLISMISEVLTKEEYNYGET